MKINAGYAQGMDYQTYNDPDNGNTARFRWYVATASDPTKLYNMTILLYESFQYSVTMEYFYMDRNGTGSQVYISTNNGNKKLAFDNTGGKLPCKTYVAFDTNDNSVTPGNFRYTGETCPTSNQLWSKAFVSWVSFRYFGLTSCGVIVSDLAIALHSGKQVQDTIIGRKSDLASILEFGRSNYSNEKNLSNH